MQSKPPYLRVGLTGGIGSGKSTVAKAFEKLGRLVLSADEIAHALTANDAAVREAIMATFGKEMYPGGGALDRRRLAVAAFCDRRRAAELNAIVHPRVFEEIDKRLAAERIERLMPYVVIEAALIFESNVDEILDRVVVVDAPEEERIRRVVQRDGSSEDAVHARMALQIAPAEAKGLADFVIVNDRNTVSLDEKVRFVDLLLRSIPPRDLPDEEGAAEESSR